MEFQPGHSPPALDTAGDSLRRPCRRGRSPQTPQLLGPGLLTGTAPATAAVPLRMADPASIQLVSPGQLVNVVLTAEGGLEDPGKKSELLAAAVPVLWTSAQGGKASQWLGTNDADGLVVVAANPHSRPKSWPELPRAGNCSLSSSIPLTTGDSRPPPDGRDHDGTFSPSGAAFAP